MSSPVLSPLQCAVQLRASVLQLARRLRPGLEAEGMGTLKLSVLSRLGRQGPMSPTELARGEGVRLQSLTRLIAELEAEGWVCRSDDPADGRRSLLALTPAGVAGLRAAVEAAEQAEAAQAIAADHGGHGFAWAKAPEDRSRLWHARDNTLYAGLGLRPGARAVITDVCVPISRLAECLTETRRDADAHGFTAPIVGHVGDGNFHMLILIDPKKPEETEGAKALQARMVARAIAMDGTCTGEHGIGLGKIEYLTDELGEAVDVMRQIKTALDPNGLMNPGKIFAGGFVNGARA